MAFKPLYVDAAFFGHPFGVGEGHARSAGAKAAGINAQYHPAAGMIVVIFLIKLLHDPVDLRVFAERVHNADTGGQASAEYKVFIKIDDLVCKCHSLKI